MLRRKREDLSSASIAAAKAASALEASAAASASAAAAAKPAASSEAVDTNSSTSNHSPRNRMENSGESNTAHRRLSRGHVHRDANGQQSGKPSSFHEREGNVRSAGGLFGERRAGTGGDGRDGQAADEAEAEQVADEISSMAGRLKESSMAINQTLRTQTQVGSLGQHAHGLRVFRKSPSYVDFTVLLQAGLHVICGVPAFCESDYVRLVFRFGNRSSYRPAKNTSYVLGLLEEDRHSSGLPSFSWHCEHIARKDSAKSASLFPALSCCSRLQHLS